MENHELALAASTFLIRAESATRALKGSESGAGSRSQGAGIACWGRYSGLLRPVSTAELAIGGLGALGGGRS